MINNSYGDIMTKKIKEGDYGKPAWLYAEPSWTPPNSDANLSADEYKAALSDWRKRMAAAEKRKAKAKVKSKMKKKNIKEGLSDEAMAVDRDHEVQMARAQLYHLANDAVKLHKLLKRVSETEGLEGWIQSKITLASDYIKSVTNHLEYKEMAPPVPAPIPAPRPMPTAGMPESVSAGGMGAGSVATAPAVRKPLIRR